METSDDPPIPAMYSTRTMYKITTEQYLRVTSQVVKDFGVPKRRFKTIFRLAHTSLVNHKNPSVYTMGLENIYTPGSIKVLTSILRTKNIIDEMGFLTNDFHVAYYRKYAHMYRVRDILIEL